MGEGFCLQGKVTWRLVAPYENHPTKISSDEIESRSQLLEHAHSGYRTQLT